ncbi:MAG: helix-turn-helix domain-containing protein [Hyphomicrobiaceae bacterium]|nr:helix-turn-helix domain-containing protein [Hyphomicrobiaceae bacterium]
MSYLDNNRPVPLERKLLSPREVSVLTGISIPQLEKWRREGGGPRWARLGDRMVKYHVEDLRTWLEAHGGRL